MSTTGKVAGIVSNLVTVEIDGPVAENELCYIDLKGTKLLAEVIKVSGNKASVQVFESTRSLKGGDPVEFHASGMVTFALIGTTAPTEEKLVFDPDKSKRHAMYPEVCEIFGDNYSIFIGGSTSFDFAGKQYNKYDATLRYAEALGYTQDEVIFIGDDFGDGGGDSHVRIKGMDYIHIHDYTKFPEAVQPLLDAKK